MDFLTNRFTKSLLGALLLCVFTLRPCAAVVRNVSLLKSLTVMEKGLEDASKETKEGKESKSRYVPEAELPASEGSAVAAITADTRKQQILHEVLGCPGPILQILTPPPDGGPRF